ncbi:MAG: hypothetical protein R3E02_11665 [Blastomonas sp.]
MAEADIIVKYEGGDADRHNVEMRALGNSLLGFERIISDGLIFLGENRLPKRGERHKLVVKAREPVVGSSQLLVDLTPYAGLLPFAWWMMQTGAAEAVSYFMTYVFTRLSGRNRESQNALDAMTKMREIEARERIATQQQWLESEAQWRDQLFALTNKLALAAIRAVTPVGPSVDTFKLNGSAAPLLIIDLPTADAIREKGELEVTELQQIDLRVDGFVLHNRKLNVENPNIPGSYISADVRDPVFEQVPNAYTEAAANRSIIRVQAKLGFRSGLLERIYIMDHGDRLDDAA